MDHLGLFNAENQKNAMDFAAVRHRLVPIKSGHLLIRGIGPWPCWKCWKIGPQIAIFPQISAINVSGFLGFPQKITVANLFSTRRESLAQTYRPISVGIAFFISSAKLTYLLCNGKGGQSVWRTQEPLKWQNWRYFKCSSLSNPRSLKSRFC